MKRPKISVAGCTCNRELYIADMLKGLADQRRPPDEVVLCDDSSRDGTVEIIRDFARRAPFEVKLLINEQRLGLARNYARAISACGGDLIALCDDDDVWMPGKLERLEEVFLRQPDTLVVFSDAQVCDEGLTPLGYGLWRMTSFGRRERRRFRHGQAAQILMRRNPAYTSALAFRRELKERVLPIPVTWTPDYWITTIAGLSGSVVSIDEPLMKYRLHRSNKGGHRKRTLSDQWAKARTGNAEQYTRQLAQVRILRRRLREMSGLMDQARVDALLQDKEDHLRCRLQIQEEVWFRRLALVARELIGRRYQKYSLGWRSAIKDAIF